ncbi:TetR/AcrR family transcriptional regulator [Bacillus sp. B15-48]|uniref:TetR/AcrR family transcriptional regulator n=1 Tax=Bacillus sp. B15-48 TaxID=1548601 RepID=UPI00193FF8F0|nr:TetR/AcrR family transcriptional regulator [Bacillus sp. B15-48]MBM4763641.1 TetR family transcriptional regulator [Bacillus sp. B15-48]
MAINMEDTGDRILFAAINLIAEKGYKAVSTKEIAQEAGVSEMTLFRHFGTKRALLETAIDKFYYTVSMKEIFQNKIVDDLKEDLLMISKAYHRMMKKNLNIIRIAIKEGNRVEGLFEQINKHPRQLKELIIEYFANMQEKGRMKSIENLEALAMAYLYMLYGEFISRNFVEGHQITSVKENEYMETAVLLFVSALEPEVLSDAIN